MYGPSRRPRRRGAGGGAEAGQPSQPSPRTFFPAGPRSGHHAQHPPFPVSVGGAAAGAVQYYHYQPQQQQQSPGFHDADFFPSPFCRVNREKAKAAAEKAWQDLRASGKGVTSWKVSQSALLALQADSWASLGFKYMNAVPLLDSLVAIEAKINTFVHCFMSVRKITSVHELGVEICKSEGVEKFEELGLGPLLQHQLVEHYFSIPSDVEEVSEIATEDILNCLGTYLYRCKKKEIPVEFISYLAEKKSVSPKEKLGVRIRSFGLHIQCIRDARRVEAALLKEYPYKKQKGKDNSESNPLGSSFEEGGCSNVKRSLQNQDKDWPFEAISASLESVPEDTASLALDKGNVNQNQMLCQSQKCKSQCHCSCHDQSRVVELSLLGMKLQLPSNVVIKVDPRKVQKLNLSNEEIDSFAMTWKEVCQKYSAAEET